MSERQQILSRLQPKILAYGLPVSDVRKVMTRLAMTDIVVLREIEATGMDEIAARLLAKGDPHV